MPFLNLNNNWSNLAQYYNQSFNNKPEVPKIKYTAFDDGLIRGGLFNATLASTRDTVRVGKFLASGNGALFITKQVGLQLSNPLLEQLQPPSPLQTSGQGFLNNVSNTITNFVNKRTPNQIYNLGLNTLTQIPLVAFGGHIIRQGLLPIGGGGYLEGGSNSIWDKGYNYEKIVLENNKLQGSKMNVIVRAGTVTYSSLNDKTNSNRLVNYLSNLNADSIASLTLQDYKGGAASAYGIGTTLIKTTNVRTTISSDKYNDPSFALRLNGFKPLDNSTIQESPQADLKSSLSEQLRQSPLRGNYNIASQEAGSLDIEHRVGVSRPGSLRKVDAINAINITDSTTYYTTLQAGGTLPNINAINASIANNPFLTGSGASVFNEDVKNKVDGYFGRDIARFVVEFIDNDAVTPLTDVLAFRAYIDDFNDGMNAKWNSYRYMGRGEDFYVYDGFSRDISVSFTIYAHSPEEMKPLYQKLNYLMSTFAPDYSPQNKMRGNIGYLTVGDYLSRQPGVFTDIKLSGFLDTHWEINLNYKLGDQPSIPQNVVPKLLKVGLSFKPIHNKLPRRVKRTNPFLSNFILPDGTTNKYA